MGDLRNSKVSRLEKANYFKSGPYLVFFFKRSIKEKFQSNIDPTRSLCVEDAGSIYMETVLNLSKYKSLARTA